MEALLSVLLGLVAFVLVYGATVGVVAALFMRWAFSGHETAAAIIISPLALFELILGFYLFIRFCESL